MKSKLPIISFRLLAVMVSLLGFMTPAFLSAQNVTVQSVVGQNVGNFLMQNLVGEGVYIYNAKYNGNYNSIPSQHQQIGTFQANGFSGLSMESGIVMTTGYVTVAEGPNSSAAAPSYGTYPSYSYYIDPQMAARNIVTNAAACSTLDFDFVSLSSSVSFTYCFGSDEYPEYVGSQYNDVFVFFLTGPDPVTGQTVTRNIAMIPGTVDADHPYGIPVAVNTVNPGQRGSSAFGTEPDGCYYTYTQYYCDNNTVGNTGIEYDGYTSKLAAAASVMPCQSYHMHISVCDVSDNSYQSGVFIEGRSFTIANERLGLTVTNVDTVHLGSPQHISVGLSGDAYDSAEVYVHFGGDAVYGIDLLCSTADGTVLNSGDAIHLGQSPSTLTLQVLPNVQAPVDFEMIFAISYCPEYPNLLVYDTVNFVLSPTASGNGIEAVGLEQMLTLLPNPASEKITVNSHSVMSRVVLVDAAGREVLARDLAGGEHAVTLDVSHLDNGVYTLCASTASGMITRQLAIRK